MLRELVDVHGTKAWAKIAGLIRSKGSKQCRRRWKNFLNMSAKTCSWSPEVSPLLLLPLPRLRRLPPSAIRVCECVGGCAPARPALGRRFPFAASRPLMRCVASLRGIRRASC